MIDRDDIARFTGKSKEMVKLIETDLFKQLKSYVTDPMLPTIHWHGFGKFYVSKDKIDQIIRAYIKQIRSGSLSELQIENRKDKIRLLWEARKTKRYNRR